ncbi:DEAD/DEAH box helicase family protein [archaeon]|jgi:SNF2 family DNA or RNA helicase|nr:DEAD/DEAH box helicase family protein [archaeon]MBT4373570.1 DEAD/DEAH box helicase family protein [archaeon]MBT4532018.1 DEAD/DEAH box helicase family protein [archaeon]MBT7001685.1 DEAD/DEAH box helicase family protein [archaeon]MBT7282423.1 DEAD/DEAH box helicase family protein [archaeon]
MVDIVINQSFSEDDLLFEKLDKQEFESEEVLNLKVEAEEISKETEINELLSYDVIKRNLEYNLPHQTEGALQILRDLNGSALLADEVGLGKTITTGIVLKECIMRGFVKKALILTPPSLVDQWVAELKEKFELDFTIIENESSWEQSNFLIASIDRVKNYNKENKKYKHSKAHEISWDILIVDEAHKLKAKNTVRWKFVDKIQKKRFLLLTATPFQNDLLELYNLLHLLKRGHLGTIKEFRKKFLNKGNKRYPLNPKELRERLQEVMVRRIRSKIGIDYKKRIPKIVAVEPTQKELDIYNAICDLLKTQYFAANGTPINSRLIVFAILPKITSSSRSAMESLTRIINDDKYHEKTKEIARQILNEYKNLKIDSKMDKLIEIVEKVLKEDSNSKTLIYTKHPTTLKYIAEKLEPYNLKVVEFMGGLDREEKTQRIKEFKESANIMISTETGCEGLNFQFCKNLINYDLPWNPMSVEQRIGRLDRIGQKNDMNIYSLATKHTMEEYVVDLIINKMCCVGLVIGELPIILFNLGLDDEGKTGKSKIEERLMNSFIDSKNNLNIFSSEVDKIAEIIEGGIEEYEKEKDYTKEALGEWKVKE